VPEQTLHEGTNGVPGDGTVEADRFGWSLAVGDFNGDGHADAAVGAPRDDEMNGTVQHGTVVLAHGHDGGLMPFDGWMIVEDLDGYLPTQSVENGDDFGWALAAGDFNCDGYDDLAIGIPGEDGVGQVMVLSGSVGSLVYSDGNPALAPRVFSQWDTFGDVEAGDRFGAALVAGDFNGDHCDDLAVGVPLEDFEYKFTTPVQDAGRVDIFFGSYPNGLKVDGSVRILSEDYYVSPSTGSSTDGESFGTTLAAGDLNGDRIDDLLVGVPQEGLAGWNAGGAMVALGEPLFPLQTRARLFYPGDVVTGFVPDRSVGEAYYGIGLAAGDFDGNGLDDLAIGGPYHDMIDGPADCGATAVLYSRFFVDGFEDGTTWWKWSKSP
jgi:hypothetical protein